MTTARVPWTCFSEVSAGKSNISLTLFRLTATRSARSPTEKLRFKAAQFSRTLPAQPGKYAVPQAGDGLEQGKLIEGQAAKVLAH